MREKEEKASRFNFDKQSDGLYIYIAWINIYFRISMRFFSLTASVTNNLYTMSIYDAVLGSFLKVSVEN